MASSIHISQARAILDSGKPVEICVWAKDGRILRYKDCVSLRWSRRSGTRTIKLVQSRQIRTVRDVCIFRVNGLDVTL